MRYAFKSRRYSATALRGLKIGDTDIVFGEQRIITAPERIKQSDDDLLTPGRQLALLILRQSDLSERLLAKLMHSTARAGFADYDELRQLGYAIRKANGFHAITPHGQWKADQIARQLAQELGVPLRIDGDRKQTEKFTRRWSGYQVGW